MTIERLWMSGMWTETPVHYHRRRRWRHLDTCCFVTMIEADLLRVHCGEHGVRRILVPWAQSGTGFTAVREAQPADRLPYQPQFQ